MDYCKRLQNSKWLIFKVELKVQNKMQMHAFSVKRPYQAFSVFLIFTSRNSPIIKRLSSIIIKIRAVNQSLTLSP